MRRVALVVVLLAASPVWAASKDMERLYLQIAGLQTEIIELRRLSEDTLRELKRLNESLAEQGALLRKLSQDGQVETEAAQAALKELTESVAELKDRVQALTGPGLGAPVASTPPAPGGAAGSSPPPLASQPAPGELYQQAYADYAHGKYDLSVQGFQEYLRLFPSTTLSDNAQYWIGECYFGQQRYPEAVAAWDDLLRRFPGTDKIPDARYKKAVALEKMGRRSHALLEYRYVHEHFPNTEAGRMARDKIRAP